MLFTINFKNSEPFNFVFPDVGKSGIYIIQNVKTKDLYVGSAVNLRQRWSRHKWALNAGIHHNQHLQRAWIKYGADYFKWAPVAYCQPEDLLHVENECIASFNTTYNIGQTASSRRGAKNSKEHNSAISEKAIARWADLKFKDAMSEKIREALKTAKKIKPEERHNARLISAYGKEMTLGEWAIETGIKRETIAYRLNNGAPPEDALNLMYRKLRKK